MAVASELKVAMVGGPAVGPWLLVRRESTPGLGTLPCTFPGLARGTTALELESANGVELRLRTVCNVVLPVEHLQDCSWQRAPARQGQRGMPVRSRGPREPWGLVDWGRSWLGPDTCSKCRCGSGLEGEE